MSTALYRRYRPDTFGDVIGQEHVTAPLMTALEKNRVNHAYLFSGPRGCGKTTSARILARCLNCEQGPTPVPCGTCPSCVDLANGGPGSLDVIEIDAASHGGVDDARDLRERATFAPTRDRYKIFIIDEAHMVTAAGFNALLKIVEEPPAHIKFIFATTEPEKVIGTIRSRTHHYPFRLVPPEALLAYLQVLCERESVSVADGVLPLVIRAGGGSVRDTLSVLDQLIAGARDGSLDYETAVALLGYTHSTLLDEVTLSLHESDGAGLFGAIDRIIQTGLDPRRFVEDVLERFRDLIIAKAMPEGLEKILRGVPEDQLEALRLQAGLVGAGELSRWADVTNKALSEMTGATSPRLHLELLAARLMLPGSQNSDSSFAARLDRLERHAMTGGALPALNEDDAEGAAPSTNAAPNPGAARQGAAAVREALAAAKSRRGGAPEPAEEQEPQVQSAQAQPQQDEQAPAPAQQPAQHAESAQAQRTEQPQQSMPPQPQPQPQPADDDPNAPLDPGAAASLNTGEAADWGATWGPKGENYSVTTEVQPGPSIPAARPEGVAPFSLVPDPSSGEDLSFGTGVSIDDVKQNPAMAEFARRAAANRAAQAPQSAQPQRSQQAPEASQPGMNAQRNAAHPAQEHAQREQAEREAQQRAAQEQAQREQAEREAQQRAVQEQAQREQAEREAQQRAAQEQAQREAQQRAAQEQAQREQAQREQAQREQAQQQQRPQSPQQPQHGAPGGTPQGQQPAPQGAGSPVAMFQQAWPTILQQLQGSSRVLHSMVATYGSVAGFDGRTLTLAFSNTGPIVNLRNRPDLMNTLTGVLSQVAGSPIEVVLTEGGSNPNGGGSPKGERRPIPAPTPAPTKFTKAVSSAGAAARAAARAQAAAPAPQQRPASAVQTSAPAAPAPRAHEGYASSYDDVPPPAEEPYFDEPPFPDDPYYSPAGSVPVAPQVQPQQQSPAPATQPEPVAPAPATSAPRSFDGPPVAPKPRMTAGMAARQAEGGVPNIARPVSSTPLHPDSTTDSFEILAVDAPEQPAPQTPERSVPEPAPAPAQPQVRPREQEQPRPEPLAPAPSPAAPAPAPEAAPRWGAPQPEPEPAPAASAPASTGRMSRYQQLMNQAKNAPSAPAPAQSARGWGGPASAPDPAPVQEPEEFVPSDDDIEVEDSALIGVPAVERLLGGMVIEQRDVNGNVVEIKRSL
ncbi:DNA polymerase III subunit gamma and tau [Glutamicibacter mysorens]|uniref:DNA polymerase III subunit gamma and tau n=1 Tax=Glutamicibacter mysorens TaxID=257984 RepID=UPI0020C6155F|nr:DNA polymerase III subunit gamma and tau [Glutamicibacter mysorens]UTM48533.1 DNA polymerase III subunit gamma and tau [Glutamicibacter mysorens]